MPLGLVLRSTALAALSALVLGALPALGAALWLHLRLSSPARALARRVLAWLSSVPALALAWAALVALPDAREAAFCLAAALAVGPSVARQGLDALATLPPALQDAARALGASEATFAQRVVLPAMSRRFGRILALATSRGVGEAALGFVLLRPGSWHPSLAASILLPGSGGGSRVALLALCALAPMVVLALLRGLRASSTSELER